LSPHCRPTPPPDLQHDIKTLPKIPSYRHHKARNLAVVTIDGKDVYLGTHNSPESHERYKRLIAEWLAEGQRTVPSAAAKCLHEQPAAVSKRPLVNELILAFFTHADRHYRRQDGKPTSELSEYRRTLGLLRELYGRTYADEFGPKALKAVRAQMIQTGWSRGVINQRVGRIKHMVKWAVENELIPPSVHQGLAAVGGLQRGRSSARETEPVKPVSEADLAATLPFLNRHFSAMAQVQLLAGMRPGETCVMIGADLDMSGKIWVFSPSAHKTAHHGHARRIAIGPKAQAILQPFLKAAGDGFLFCPRTAMLEYREERRRLRKTPVPENKKTRRKNKPRRQPGACYTPSSYAHAVRAACLKAKLAPWHPHQLRHSAGTIIRREFGLDMARVILGHRSPQITELYAEIDMERAREVMEKLG
jgi:integrase